MYNHLTLQMYDPTLERSDYVGKATALQITNRGAVAHQAPMPPTYNDEIGKKAKIRFRNLLFFNASLRR